MPNCSLLYTRVLLIIHKLPYPGQTQSPLVASTRVLLAVESHARPLLNLVCTQLLASRSRSISLVLAQVHATKHVARQQEVSQRRILDNFESLAQGGWGRGLLRFAGCSRSSCWVSIPIIILLTGVT